MTTALDNPLQRVADDEERAQADPLQQTTPTAEQLAAMVAQTDIDRYIATTKGATLEVRFLPGGQGYAYRPRGQEDAQWAHSWDEAGLRRQYDVYGWADPGLTFLRAKVRKQERVIRDLVTYITTQDEAMGKGSRRRCNRKLSETMLKRIQTNPRLGQLNADELMTILEASRISTDV